MRGSIFFGLGALSTVSLAVSLGMGCGGSTTSIDDDGGGGSDATTDSPNTGREAGAGGSDATGSSDGNVGIDSSPGNETGSGSETGTTFEAGATGSSTINCPTTPCGTGLGCCVNLGADAGFTCEATCTNSLQCLANADCSGSTPICCAQAVIDDPTGSPPGCIKTGAKEIATQCTASSACASDIKLTPIKDICNETDTVRGCTTPTDCNDPAYPKCCEITVSGATLQGCVSTTIASLGKLTCM